MVLQGKEGRGGKGKGQQEGKGRGGEGKGGEEGKRKEGRREKGREGEDIHFPHPFLEILDPPLVESFIEVKLNTKQNLILMFLQHH